MFDSKARLDALQFTSLDEMIRAYADEAVVLARQQHRVLLDFTPASVPALERLLDGQAAVDLDFQSRLWGSYFGEVLRRRWNGIWVLAPYPGNRELAGKSDSVIPTLDVAGSRLWPTMKVYRRLTHRRGRKRQHLLRSGRKAPRRRIQTKLIQRIADIPSPEYIHLPAPRAYHRGSGRCRCLCDNEAAEKTPALKLEGHATMGELLTPTHLILVLVVALLVFGPRKLPELGKGLGEGLKGFKDGIKGMGQPEPTAKQDATPSQPKNEPIQPS